MAKIRILPDRVANQIAAGEVIERPAAIVKELVENALDAGATRIEVEFRNGGRSYIRVEDNGCGMVRDDALLSVERHATSKILEAADLDRLNSFGFRGEALPSIASVSRFLMQTRFEGEEVGSEILISGGKFVHVRDCGLPVGTRITITHLFQSVPARRKFLKTDATEAAHIIQCARFYALAYPQVAFSLLESGRTLFQSPRCAELIDRVAEIFGRQICQGLLPLEVGEPGMRLRGLVSKPGVGRSSRHEMVTFVNRRPVESRTLHYALVEAYHPWLPKGRFPVAFLFLEIDPAAVDVNIHPAKREVRFREEPHVRSFVIRALLDQLHPRSEAARSPDERQAEPPECQGTAPGAARPELVPAAALRPTAAAWTRAVASAAAVAAAPAALRPPALERAPDTPAAGQPAARIDWRYLGAAHGTFALFETPSGLALVNRRAAHERIWFERICAEFLRGAVSSQKLLFATPVELDPVAAALLMDNLELLMRHGFEVVPFGRNFYRIEAVPAWLEPSDAERFLRDTMGLIREGRISGGQPEAASEELARLAARRGVRLPEDTAEPAMRSLVTQLFACRHPITSPTGVLTHIELSQGELARRFHG